MLLENLYRVLFDTQRVTLQDIRGQKIKLLWHGTVRDIPVEYLSRTVENVISYPININASVIRIDLI